MLTAEDGPTALDIARAQRPDLVVLDLMLRKFSDAYVLMLTARTEEIDKIVGLSVGADDCLTKPFSPRELVARVKAMLRQPHAGATALYAVPAPRRFGELVIDEARHGVRPSS